MDLGLLLDGKVTISQYIGFAVVDEAGQIRPVGSQLVGDMAQGLVAGNSIRLTERLEQRG